MALADRPTSRFYSGPVRCSLKACSGNSRDEVGMEKAAVVTHSDGLGHNQAVEKNIKTISSRIEHTRYPQRRDLSRTKARKTDLLRGRVRFRERLRRNAMVQRQPVLLVSYRAPIRTEKLSGRERSSEHSSARI